jgi:hypothetical protein
MINLKQLWRCLLADQMNRIIYLIVTQIINKKRREAFQDYHSQLDQHNYIKSMRLAKTYNNSNCQNDKEEKHVKHYKAREKDNK